jgi:Methyltransferase domain
MVDNMNSLDRLLRGSERRKSRFHDERGNLIDLKGVVYAPRALAGTVARKLFDVRPVRPWISYRAVKFLDEKITPSWHVIEFGSGMSTLWFARRCGFLHSIENNPRWHQLLSRRLQAATNVRYELRSLDEYGDVSDYADASVDLAFVDGAWRSRCVENVLPKIRPGGYLYLDNTDLEGDQPDGDIPRAESLALSACKARGGTYRYFVDFRPGRFEVTQGLLVQF